jgi:hypothetical protein
MRRISEKPCHALQNVTNIRLRYDNLLRGVAVLSMLSPFSSLVSRVITLCFIRVQLMVAQVHGGQMKRERLHILNRRREESNRPRLPEPQTCHHP